MDHDILGAYNRLIITITRAIGLVTEIDALDFIHNRRFWTRQRSASGFGQALHHLTRCCAHSPPYKKFLHHATWAKDSDTSRWQEKLLRSFQGPSPFVVQILWFTENAVPSLPHFSNHGNYRPMHDSQYILNLYWIIATRLPHYFFFLSNVSDVH